MTETTAGRRAVSEITRADYRAITDTAYSLSFRIHDLMNRLDGGPEDPAWHELHELMQLGHVLAGAAGRYAKRAELPQEPVAYQPADWPARLLSGCTCGTIGNTGSHFRDCAWSAR